MTEEFEFNDNINMDCAHHCAQRGFVLAGTMGKMCTCMQTFPHELLVSPMHDNSSGIDSPCGITCPGAYVKANCEGDECCGGDDAYSVYSTGRINLQREVNLRLKQALKRQGWVNDVYQEECSNDFEVRPSEYGDVFLELQRDEFTHHNNVNSAAACTELCAENSECRSVTYVAQLRRCYCNTISCDIAHTQPTNLTTVVFERNCTATVNVSNNFIPEMQLLKVERVMDHSEATERLPLGDHDFELDLTHSSEKDSVRREIKVESSEGAVIETLSGFENSASFAESTFNSHFRAQEKAQGFRYTESGGYGASTSIHGWFVSVEASYNRHWENMNSGSVRNSDAELNGGSQYSLESSSKFASSGNKEILTSRDAKLYEFTLTVPPFHKGYINFFMENYELVYKWRATYMLNGYISIRHPYGYNREIHVSKLLTRQERLFYTLGSLSVQRKKIIGKTTIIDKNGNKLVETSS